ncbi:MAG TPA: DUF3108 domain-containing protein [Candidatus Binatia bacterium]|nr:DUF3108 domain-containing protein [Candidatus Binatia bacterium]
MTTSIVRCRVVLAVLLFAMAAASGLSGGIPFQTPAQAQGEARIGSSSHIQPLRASFQFPYGQTFHYQGEWRFWTAGVATLRIESAGSQDHIEATADSTGVVALLYRVQDRFNSWMDAKSLCSYRLMKHSEEGSHRRETTITYDYNRGKAILEERSLKDNQQKKIENDVPGCVTDVLSGILYVSSLPLQPGATYTFPLNDGGKTVTVQAHVEGNEQIKTPAGTFQTVRVGPEGSSGILKNHGRIWIWYSDDGRHLPIQMRAKLLWGTLTIYLTGIGK